MVHTPIQIKKAMTMPAAKEALEKEWKKLEDKKAWLEAAFKEGATGTAREQRAPIKHARKEYQPKKKRP